MCHNIVSIFFSFENICKIHLVSNILVCLTFYFLLIFIYSNEIDDVNDIFPKLSAYLQLASNSALKGAPSNKSSSKSPPLLDIKTSPPSSPDSGHTSPAPTKTNASSANTSSMMTTTTATTTTSSGIIGSKISLVPTNILMKPQSTAGGQTSTAKFSFKPQQFFSAKAGSGTPTIIQTTSANGQPMKVLLVNTLQKPNNASSTSTVSVSTKPIISTPLTTRSLVNIQPKPITVQNANMVQSSYQTRSTTAANAQASKAHTLLSSNKYLCSGSPSNHNESMARRHLAFKKKTSPGFCTLLNQLVQLQQKQLEVSQQRLEVERERLDFERNVGDKMLNALTSLLQSKVEPKDDSK